MFKASTIPDLDQTDTYGILTNNHQNEYLKKIQRERIRTEENMTKIQELERQELELLSNLKHTQD